MGGILHIELNKFFVPHLKSRHKTPPLFYVNVECISNIVGNLFLSAFTCIALINFLRKEPWPTVCACSFRETLNKPITGFVGSLFMEACVIRNVAQFWGRHQIPTNGLCLEAIYEGLLHLCPTSSSV